MPKLTEAEFGFLTEMERYDAFLLLYHSVDPEDREALETLYRSSDPLIPLILMQYLADIPEKRALFPLLTLIEEPNAVVARAAMSAYRRSHYPGKARLLKQLILSKSERACRFAVRTLSRAGMMDALPLILRELPERTGAVRDEMIVALQYLPDRRSVNVLLPLASCAEEPLRVLAVAALAGIQGRVKAVPASFFVEKTHDASEGVRRAAMDALRNYPTRRVARLLLTQAIDPAEPEAARDRAIRSLAGFPAVEWIRPLAALLAAADSPALSLAAEIALKGFPPRLLRRGLRPLLSDPEPAVRRRSAMLLAEFLGGEPDVRRDLLTLWDQAEDGDALDLVDVLRELGGPESARRLRASVLRSPLLAYASAGALPRMKGSGGGLAGLDMLKDPHTPAPAQQAILNHWARRGPDEAVAPALLPWLAGALENDVINTRYLALQVLGWYPLSEKLDALLGLLAREANPEIVQTASKQIQLGLGRDPIPLVLALQRIPERARLAGHTVRILTSQSWDRDLTLELLRLLEAFPLSLLSERPETYFAVCVHLLENDALTLEAVWAHLDDGPRRRLFLRLLTSAMRDPRRAFPPLPLAFLASMLAGADAESRKLYCDLLGADRRPAAAEDLTAQLLRETDPAVRRHGARRLGELLAEVPA